MTKAEIRAELRRSAMEDESPCSGVDYDAWLAADYFLTPADLDVRAVNECEDQDRTFFLIAAEAMWEDGTPRSTINAFNWEAWQRDPIPSTWNSGWKASESREKSGSQSMKLKGSLQNTDPRYFHIFTRA